MGPQKNDREGGFTLLEALVAITILAFGLLAVVSMIDVSFSAGTLSKSTTRATELAAMMMDRVAAESAGVKQKYTADITKLRSFDNDLTPNISCDTSIAAAPLTEPGRSACSEWRAAVQPAIQNASTALPGGRGILTITPYDPAWSGNHRVTVRVSWQGVLTRSVTIDTVLATAE